MKYIIGLSLSAIGLAAFLLLMQAGPIEKGVGLEKVLKSVTSPIDAEPVKKETLPPPADEKIMIAKAGKKNLPVPTSSTKKKTAEAITKSEKIKKIVKERPWNEARPEVIRILNEGGRRYQSSTRDDVKEEMTWRLRSRQDGDDDEDDNDDDDD